MASIFDRRRAGPLRERQPKRSLYRPLLWAAVAASIGISSIDGAHAAPLIEGHFSLSNNAGQGVTNRTFQGKWTLIYFGFASCPEICSTVMQRVATALIELGPATKKLQPLFITLDPINDTPERLSTYLSNFDSRVIGLSGTQQQTQDAVQSFRMFVKRRQLDNGFTTIDHSSFLFLMKPDGSFARLLSGDTSGHNLADELRHQLQ